MANLTENPVYETGIYRFETTDPVQGGPGGIDNLPTNQLANRTAWLKAQVEAILLDITAIESGYATAASLAGHTGNTSNPHSVTKAQVGLGSVLNYGVATQAEAEAGVVDTKYITPLRAKQAIAALVPAASETVAGLIELASTAEAQGMLDNFRAITPSTLAAALKGSNQTLGISGYQKLPGGLILQWGIAAAIGNGTVAISFPIAFPTSCLQVTGGHDSGGASALNQFTYGFSFNATTMTIGARADNGEPIPIGVRWIAVGY